MHVQGQHMEPASTQWNPSSQQTTRCCRYLTVVSCCYCYLQLSLIDPWRVADAILGSMSLHWLAVVNAHVVHFLEYSSLAMFSPPPLHPTITPHPPPFPRMLQGDVLWSFLDMDQRAQAAVAGAVGCDVNDLLRDLQALTVATHMF